MVVLVLIGDTTAIITRGTQKQNCPVMCRLERVRSSAADKIEIVQ